MSRACVGVCMAYFVAFSNSSSPFFFFFFFPLPYTSLASGLNGSWYVLTSRHIRSACSLSKSFSNCIFGYIGEPGNFNFSRRRSMIMKLLSSNANIVKITLVP